MAEKEEILKLLHFYGSDYISAEMLGKRLGVPKHKIYSYIQALRKEGHVIFGCQNRGYALFPIDDPLTPASVAASCRLGQNQIRVFKTLPSTNTTAKEMASLGAPEGTVCIAETQTKGRGRMDRVFFSPAQTGLYMSIILRPEIQPADALLITTLAAVSVAETIESLTGEEAKIKWVNDVYYHEKKVCGILTEAAFCADTKALDYVVLGIGVNIYNAPDGFPTEIESIAGAIFPTPVPYARSKIAAGILNRFFEGYKTITTKPHLNAYQEKSILTGKSVTVYRGNEIFRGKVLNISDDFSLEIELPDGQTTRLSSGEVSIKME